MSLQRSDTVTEMSKRNRKSYAVRRRLEDDEIRDFPDFELIHQFFTDSHFRNTSVGQTAHESSATNIGLIDFQSQT